MTSDGDCYDNALRESNALCESVFATLESELLNRRSFRTEAESKMALFDFIEGWYNPQRRHAPIADMSPLAFERS